jgi:hypothetical protein
MFTPSSAFCPQRRGCDGRTSFRAKEYFDWRFLLALIVFIALLFAHAALFGVSTFPD